MTLQEAVHKLKNSLPVIYDPRESANIAEWVMEYVTGLPRIDRIMHHGLELTSEQQSMLKESLAQLLDGRPVQYVTGYAWFMGLRFRVNEDVLIPRPETEELVEWTVREWISAGAGREITVIDIGTGSGCIPVMLKRLLPRSAVHTVDVSPGALLLARENAENLGAEIYFHQADFLDAAARESLPSADIIISNPPYVPLKDRQTMAKNVLAHEPNIALFVPDEDPLLFYRAIASFGMTHLSAGGSIFLEIHEQYALELTEAMNAYGYAAETRWDMQGKDRMMKLVKK